VEFLGIDNFWAFLLAGILLNLTPGNDTMYILGRSMAHGVKAGIFSALGISTGSLVHTLAAATGLSLVLTKSPTTFHIIKFCGAAYLVYLGIRILFSAFRSSSHSNQEKIRPQYSRIYLSGILTNVLNPKVALFFLAFLPQFIDPNFSNPMLSFMVLGITFIATGTCWCLLLAVFAARFSALFSNNGRQGQVLQKLSGALFVGLGVKLAFMKQ
jgi:threonine/homoserine/homoserine lactone efflux protein